MKKALLIMLLTLSGCAGAPLDTNQRNWIEAFNSAASPEVMERAAEQMERSDYIRYSQQAIKFVANRQSGSYAPTELEREFVYFFITRFYMQKRQMRPTAQNVEKSRIFMRKLLECSNLHNMSRYVIARVQELDGIPSSTSQVKVPRNQKYWLFGFGTTGNDLVLDDLRQDYEKIVSDRQNGKLGGVFHALAFASLIGSQSVAFNNQLGLSEMNHVISLNVSDERGVPVTFTGSAQN